MTQKSLQRILLAGVAVVALTASANASIIATLAGGAPAPSAGTPGAFDYTYNLTLAADEQLVGGSFFTLYDFGPASAVSTTGLLDNFTFAQALTNVPAALTIPPDSPTVLNIRGTYDGSLGTLTGFNLGNGANGNLGTLTLTSDLGGFHPTFQDSEAQHFVPPVGGGVTGTVDSNVTASVGPATVPEPASLALLGSALLGFGYLRRRKNG